MVQKKEANNQRIKEFIERTILICIFLVFWLFMSVLYVTQTSGITVLSYSYNQDNILKAQNGELLKGEKIVGDFTAKDNNLGIVAVRFNTFSRINEDVVRFRIKEKPQKNWYYENNYTTPQFQPNQLFTFGFPIISDSKGKEYIFEVESLEGQKGNAVTLSTKEPAFVTKHQYSKGLILHNRSYLLSFLLNKTINLFTDLNYIISSIVYALPLLLYLIKILLFDKYLSDKSLLSVLPILFMISLCFVELPRSDEVIIGIIGLWIVVNIAYKLQSTLSLILACFFIISTAILYYLHLETIATNFAVWGFMLWLSGLTLKTIELVWERESRITVKTILPKLKL